MINIKRDFIQNEGNSTRILLNIIAYVIYIASILGVSIQEFTTWGLLLQELVVIISSPAQIGLIIVGTLGFFTNLKGDL